MTSLQQVVQSTVCPDPKASVLSVHRRSMTLLVGGEGSVYPTRQDESGKWLSFSTYQIPSQTCKVLGYFSLEAYSCFAIALACKESVVAAFVDLSGNLLNSWPISGLQVNPAGLCSVDIDQNRRELILVNDKNELFSIALRGVLHEAVKGLKDGSHPAMVFEALVRIRGHLNPRSTPPPIQLICNDLQGMFITLNKEGQIMGFDTGSLDVLWVLERHLFLHKPSYVQTNRFGPGLFIYAHSKVGKVSRLEYWSPPESSVGCSAGTFSRAVVPLTAPLCGLSVESLGSDLGTYAVVVQADRQVLLWKIVSKNKLFLDAKITLTNGYAEAFRKFTIDKMIHKLSKYENLKQHPGGGKNVNTSLRNLIPGIITFSGGSGIPDSPMTITLSVGHVFTFLSMHGPRKTDLKWLGWTHDEFRTGVTEAVADRDQSKHTILGMLENRFNLSAPVQRYLADTAVKTLLTTMTDGVQEDEEPQEEIVLRSTVDEEAYINEDKPPAPIAPSSSSYDRGGELVIFSPLSLLDSATWAASRKSLALEAKDGSMGLVLPSSVLATTSLVRNGKKSSYECDIRLIQRGGLYLPYDVDSSGASASLYATMGVFSYRTRKFVCLTDLKEIFWMSLPPFVNDRAISLPHHKQPVKSAIDIKAVNVTVTVLTAGDVFLRLPSDRLAGEALAGLGAGAAQVSGGIVGNWVATFAGDSMGNVHFYVTNDDGVVQQGQFKAFSSVPLAAILMTGDPMRPMWRLGATNVPVTAAANSVEEDALSKSGRVSTGNKPAKTLKGSSRATQLRCIAIPGSALVTVAKDGEVKIWQPIFTQLPRSKASLGQLMNIFEISWRMSGVFSGLGSPFLYISSAALDPTCMSIMISTSNGFLLQWPLPGLVETGTGSLATCRESIFSCRRHDTSVSSMRVWVDSSSTSINEVAQSGGANVKEISKYASLIRGPLSGTVGYTNQDLHYLSGNSSLVTCATDSSIVLWRFMPSKVFQGPDSVSGGCRYLCPTPCKRFFMSAIPRDGICFPILGNPVGDTGTSSTGGALAATVKATGSSLTWCIQALLNGVVINVAQSPFYTLFDVAGFNGEQTGATLETSLRPGEYDDHGDDEGVVEETDDFDNVGAVSEAGNVLLMMPAVANVIKPGKLSVLTPKRIGDKMTSWNLLNSEWLHRNADDQPNTQLEVSLLGLSEFASRPADTAKLYETLAGSRPSSTAGESGGKEGRTRSKSPSHYKSGTSTPRMYVIPGNKIDIGIEEGISVMPGIRLPSDVPDKPAPLRSDGLLPVMQNGYRILVTEEQVDDVSDIIAHSADENNRMVYNSPETKIGRMRNPLFDVDTTCSTIDTPFTRSIDPIPLSPTGSHSVRRDEGIVPVLLQKSRTMDGHIRAPPEAKVIVDTYPASVGKGKMSSVDASHTISEKTKQFSPHQTTSQPDIPLDLHSESSSIVVNRNSKAGQPSSGVSSAVAAATAAGAHMQSPVFGKHFVGRVPSVTDSTGHFKDNEVMMTPQMSMDSHDAERDNLSVDSEFDPHYIETTMSLMSSTNSGRIDQISGSQTSSIEKVKGSSGSSLVLNSSAVDIKPPPPRPPSTLPSPTKEELVAGLDAALPAHLPLDDELRLVGVSEVMVNDDASEVSDMDLSFDVKKYKPKSLSVAEQRALKVKYISKPRVSAPSVKGKVVLQPYVTPKIGFIPSKNFYEQKMHEGQHRVVVEKKPKANQGGVQYSQSADAVGMHGMGLPKPSCTTLGIVGEGDDFVLGKSTEIVQNDRFFDWSADPLFVLRGSFVDAVNDEDSGFNMFAAIPDDHVMFSQVDTNISSDVIINDLTQLESSKLKRMTENERLAFMAEKKEEHERQLEASKHFFREMLGETNIVPTTVGGPRKRNALQKTTLSANHLMKWGFVKQAIDNGAMSHDDLEEILKQAAAEEREILTTAEKERNLRMDIEQRESFNLGPLELDSANYSDTESEATLHKDDRSMAMPGMSFEFDDQEEEGFGAVDIDDVGAMDGAKSRPHTGASNRSAPRSPTDPANLAVHFTDSARGSPPGSATPYPLEESMVLHLAAKDDGQLIKHENGLQTFISKKGVQYVQQPGSQYFVKKAGPNSPTLNVRDYTSAASPGAFTSSNLNAASSRGAMVSRSKRDQLSRTPQRRKISPKKHRKGIYDDDSSDDDDAGPMQRNKSAAQGKPKHKGTRLKKLIESTMLKMPVKEPEKLSKHPPDGTVEDALTAMMAATSVPAEGELTFLGFSKFLKAVNAKMVEAAKPPQIVASIKATSHDSVTLHLQANKKCAVWALITNAVSEYVPDNKDFDNLKGLMEDPEVVAMNAGIIGEEDEDELEIDLVLRILKPEKTYNIYFCCDLVKRKANNYDGRTPNIVIEDCCITIKTSPEPIESQDIEWNRLTAKQQEIEVKAAARSLSVQAATRLVGVSIPTDEEIAIKNKPAQVPALKKWTNFVTWWTGGDLELGFSAPRVEFQSDEILFVVRDNAVRKACFDQGFLSNRDMNNINSYLFDMSSVDPDSDEVIDTDSLPVLKSIDLSIFDDPSFQFFRSWYKGGRVCERMQYWNSPVRLFMRDLPVQPIEDAVVADENDDISTALSMNDSITEATEMEIRIPKKGPQCVSDFPYNAEKGKKLSQDQLAGRATQLTLRVQYVEAQKKAAMQLLEQHKLVESKGLRFVDLQTKRGTLSQQDIDALMGSRKLSDLCRSADVEIFRLPGQFMQRVSKADIFTDSPKHYLLPDNPPPMIKGDSENGGKMPVKLWSASSDLEKELECRIACMLDCIAELAIADGVYVPSLEDADMDSTLVPVRSSKWKKFVEWYVGSEKPSNERISFSKGRLAFSDWEKKVAGTNFLVHLRIRGKPPTVLVEPDMDVADMDADSHNEDDNNSIGAASVGSESTVESHSVTTKELSIEPLGLSIDEQKKRIAKQQESVTDRYVDTVNTHSGAETRTDMFIEYMHGINASRYASTMRCIWPSAPPRQATQFMFPRMGLITPDPEAHTLHMKLYASRKSDGYTIKDIMKFYSIEELNSDDASMQKAEEKGKKFEEYIVWLSKEKDRVAEGREMMLGEDIAGMKFRIMQENLARKLADPVGNARFSGYAMVGPLSGNYEGIADDTKVFPAGDGCLNEDEIYDIKDDMIRRAREGFLALKEKKRLAMEEQRKAEEMEKIRAEKVEREKRIQAGVVRRQNIRAKLNLLKEERELRQMVAERDRLLAEEEEQRRLAHELMETLKEGKRHQERQNELRELAEMGQEEDSQREKESLHRNRLGMASEDSLSNLREELDAYADEILAERLKDLKELYTPMVPFEFKQRRAQMGWLDKDVREPFYERVTVPISPSGSRFPREKKERLASPTMRVEEGKLVYPLSQSSKLHSSRSDKQIRLPNISVKESRFNSPPRYPSPIVEAKIPMILSQTAPLGSHRREEPCALYSFEADMSPAAIPIRKSTVRRTDVMYSASDFLPAIAKRNAATITSAPKLSTLNCDEPHGEESGDNDDASGHGASVGSTESFQLPPVLNVTACSNSGENSKKKKDPLARDKKQVPTQRASIEMSAAEELKYIISHDVTGLQNRKKLLRASLSGLDWKNESLKVPRANLESHRHKASLKLVDRVKKEKDDVKAYLSEPKPTEELEDKYYLMACEPGLRQADSVNASKRDIVNEFRNALFQNIESIEELGFNVSEKDLAVVFSPSILESYAKTQTVLVDEADVKSLNDDISIDSAGSAAVMTELESELAEARVKAAQGSVGESSTLELHDESTLASYSAQAAPGLRSGTATLTIEPEYPKGKKDYRQVIVPPPYYRKTFGILGERKDIIAAKNLKTSSSSSAIGIANISLQQKKPASNQHVRL